MSRENKGKKRKTDIAMIAASKREKEVKKRMAHLEQLALEADAHKMSYGKYVEKLKREGKYDAE
jgi:hypothetical protein